MFEVNVLNLLFLNIRIGKVPGEYSYNKEKSIVY